MRGMETTNTANRCRAFIAPVPGDWPPTRGGAGAIMWRPCEIRHDGKDRDEGHGELLRRACTLRFATRLLRYAGAKISLRARRCSLRKSTEDAARHREFLWTKREVVPGLCEGCKTDIPGQHQAARCSRDGHTPPQAVSSRSISSDDGSDVLGRRGESPLPPLCGNTERRTESIQRKSSRGATSKVLQQFLGCGQPRNRSPLRDLRQSVVWHLGRGRQFLQRATALIDVPQEVFVDGIIHSDA